MCRRRFVRCIPFQNPLGQSTRIRVDIHSSKSGCPLFKEWISTRERMDIHSRKNGYPNAKDGRSNKHRQCVYDKTRSLLRVDSTEHNSNICPASEWIVRIQSDGVDIHSCRVDPRKSTLVKWISTLVEWIRANPLETMDFEKVWSVGLLLLGW